MLSVRDRCKLLLESRTDFTFLDIITLKNHIYSCKVKAVCANGHELERLVNTFIKKGCPVCNNVKSRVRTRKEIIQLLRSNGLSLTQWDGKSTANEAYLECTTCHYEFKVKSLQPCLYRSGCPKCAKLVRKEPYELVLEAAKNKWSLNWIEYSEDLYTDSVMKARCQKCGVKHSGAKLYRFINGLAVCQNCSANYKGFNHTLPATLYYLRIEDGYKLYYKIGITNRSVKERFFKVDLERITVISEVHYENGIDALNEERRILDSYRTHRYKGEPILTSGGNTELFVKDVLELDNP